MNLAKGSLKIWVAVSYVIMIATNTASVVIPLNDVTAKQISDRYLNLFTPAGLTFSVWSVIYLMLLGFVVYQWKVPTSQSIFSKEPIGNNLRWLFIVSSLLNSAWIFAWQYLKLGLSVLIMLLLLLSLIYLNRLLPKYAQIRSDKIWILIPFGIYFGWITIATIANITAFLTNLNWSFLLNHAVFWMNLVVFVGLMIAFKYIWIDLNTAYGWTIFWGYLGLMIKHVSTTDGFSSAYPSVIVSLSVCLLVLGVMNIRSMFKNRQYQSR